MNNSAQSSFALKILALWRRGKSQEAVDSCCIEIEANPGNFEAYYLLGETLELVGMLKEAIPVYQTAIQVNPTDIPVRINLAIAFLELGELMKSKKAYFQATKIDEIQAEEAYNRRAYQKLKKYK